MATVSVILKTHRRRNDGTFPICIRVTEKNKTRYKYIGHSVKQDQFKSGTGDWVKRHPDALFINSIIEDERAKMQEKLTRLRLDGKTIDLDYIISDKPLTGHTLGEILSYIATRHENNHAITLQYRHLSIRNQVLGALEGDVSLQDITIDHVRRIEVHFRQVEKNGANTISRKIRFLRSAFREAQALWGISTQNPFELVKVKGAPVKRTPLTQKQLQDISELKLMSWMDLARDAFMFSYYAQGMRFEKVVTLTRSQVNDGYIDYQMNKGLHFRRIEIHPKLKALIDKYISGTGPYLFPILKKVPKDKKAMIRMVGEANAMINVCLKRIAILAGIPINLSFHIAKHSFAQAAKRAGVDPWVIKDSLGHATFKVTEEYLKSLDDDHINEAISKVY